APLLRHHRRRPPLARRMDEHLARHARLRRGRAQGRGPMTDQNGHTNTGPTNGGATNGHSTNSHSTNGTGAPNAPATIASYLAELKRAMKGCPPAVIRDAMADAEEHMRNELAQDPNRTEAQMLGEVVENYGTPEEIAEEYRAMERTLAGPFARPD